MTDILLQRVNSDMERETCAEGGGHVEMKADMGGSFSANKKHTGPRRLGESAAQRLPASSHKPGLHRDLGLPGLTSVRGHIAAVSATWLAALVLCKQTKSRKRETPSSYL